MILVMALLQIQDEKDLLECLAVDTDLELSFSLLVVFESKLVPYWLPSLPKTFENRKVLEVVSLLRIVRAKELVPL